jgi:hypothetical protein
MKIFTNSHLNDHEILRKATLGFELEFYSKLNYPMTVETFNRKLPGIKVHGFKQYHSKMKPDEENFKLEPDLSGGFNMAELVTGPMEYNQARLVLVKCLKIIQEIGYTTDRSSVHINISFGEESGKNIEQLNILKLILSLEETKVYQHFPNRENNIYAKSIKDIIPYRDYDYTNSTINVLNNSLQLPKTKYYGVNFSTMNDGRLEFRYVGGEDYQFKINDIMELLDYFVKLTWDSLGTQLEESETNVLRRYLDDNIRSYKTLSKYENFIAQYPTIDLQIDKRTDFELVKSYYPKIYYLLYDLLSYSKGLENCIINYDTEKKRLEVVDAEIETLNLINNIYYISCNLINGDFSECFFLDCSIKNAILNGSEFKECEIENSKLMECQAIKDTVLNKCYFADGVLDCQMNGGVFRSGKIGENAVISDETKILNDDNNFFNFKTGGDIETSDKKKPYYKKYSDK